MFLGFAFGIRASFACACVCVRGGGGAGGLQRVSTSGIRVGRQHVEVAQAALVVALVVALIEFHVRQPSWAPPRRGGEVAQAALVVAVIEARVVVGRDRDNVRDLETLLLLRSFWVNRRNECEKAGRIFIGVHDSSVSVYPTHAYM